MCVSVCVCESEYKCSVVCVVCDECVTLHYFLIYYVSNVPKLQLGKTQSRKGAFVVTSSVSFVRPESVEDANQPIRILAARRTVFREHGNGNGKIVRCGNPNFQI